MVCAIMLKHQAPFPYMDVDLDDASNTRYSVSLGQGLSHAIAHKRRQTSALAGRLGRRGTAQAAWLHLWRSSSAGACRQPIIAIPYPSATGSQAAFVYDAGRGVYLRSMGGAPHLDGNTGAQIARRKRCGPICAPRGDRHR